MNKELIFIGDIKKTYDRSVICMLEVFFRYKSIKGYIEIETNTELTHNLIKDIIMKEFE